MTRWRALCAMALVALAACERASFESLGTFSTRSLPVDAGWRPSIPEQPAAPTVEVDAGLASSGPAGQPAAGSGGISGTSGAGSGGSSGGGGAAEPPAALSGTLDMSPFAEVEAGYVIGRSDEFGTTTVYLIDSSVTCDQISKLLWLAPMPSKVQVIELSFPSSAALGTPVSGSVVGYAHGGMYGFQKSLASAHSLVLSQNMSGGAVAGRLEASFGAGKVSGTFYAAFCANGVSF